MKETITIQVGQCGNQIGNYFWNLLLKEQQLQDDTQPMPEAFFHYTSQSELKARALLIDMECGPLQETMKSPIGPLFDETQFVLDVYGCGNNFTTGHYLYGPKYRDSYEEGLRRNVECCSSVQNFMVTHSLGGGTGSGVGTYMLKLLHELYPKICRFSVCVFPSEHDDDVVTSPYNSILSSQQLIEHADCVFPLDNHALQAFNLLEQKQRNVADNRYALSNPSTNTGYTQSASRTDGGPSSSAARGGGSGFDEMNSIAARMICHLTSSHRFPGDLNIDVNDICTNLIPYPQLHFLTTAMSPQRSYGTAGISGAGLSSSTILNTSSNSGNGKYKIGGPAKAKRTGASSSSSSVSSSSNSSTASSARRGTVAVSNLPNDTYVKLLGRAFSDLVSPAGQLTATIPCSQVRMPLSPSHIQAKHSPRAPNSPPAPPTGTGGSDGSGSSPYSLAQTRPGDGQQSAVMIASAFLVRGRSVPMSDFLSCVLSAQRKFNFPAWNQNACKIGLCSVPAPHETLSVLGIYNSTAFGEVFTRERKRFNTLFRRRAMAHHYTEYITIEDIAHADNVVANVCADYDLLNCGQLPIHQRYEDSRRSLLSDTDDTGGFSDGNRHNVVKPRSNRCTPTKLPVYDVNTSSSTLSALCKNDHNGSTTAAAAVDVGSSHSKYTWTPVSFPVF